METPNKIPWPPIIYANAALIALLLQWKFPLPWVTDSRQPMFQLAGLVLMAFALAIEFATGTALHKKNTTILPHRPASTLVTDGPYAWSRNPIYFANTILIAGAGLLFGAGWLILAAPIAAALTSQLAVKREEKHLEHKFGEAWRQYAARVPR
jgi:protein-S-isoprenylcysteine O-methyltransferase Ste14